MKLFIAGTFDGLHMGHQWLLWSSVHSADEMVVVVARDKTVQRLRGRSAAFAEGERVDRLRTEQLPHTVIRLGREDGDFLKTLEEESPDVLILGFDQNIDDLWIKKRFPNLEIRRAEKYFPAFFKSSYFRYTKEK